MLEEKRFTWIDILFVCSIVVVAGLTTWGVFNIYKDSEEEKEAAKTYAITLQKQEDNQYKSLSDYLKVDEKNIIISGENGDGYLVKTNKKSYTVIFNDNGKEIEKIIEN